MVGRRSEGSVGNRVGITYLFRYMRACGLSIRCKKAVLTPTRFPGSVAVAIDNARHARLFCPQTNVKHSRDLLDIQNIGEFAFAMCAMGLVLAVIAFAAAFFLWYWLGIANRSQLILLTAAFWIALNVPIYRSLRRKAESWGGERRATRQVAYIEICSTLMLLGVSLLARDISGGRELILFLRYLFSSWILCLLGYQALLHLILGYRISKRDALRWCVVATLAIYSFYA